MGDESKKKDKGINITHETRKNVTIFHLNGSLTMLEVPVFNKYIYENKDKNIIAIEFGGVDFIDSSGIGALVSILSNLKSTNGQLICYNLSDYIKSIFDMAKLGSFLNILSKREFNRKYPKVGNFEDIMRKRKDDL
ncbi:MAG: STAS domain-containing protein [Spirochaetota bacterium]